MKRLPVYVAIAAACFATLPPQLRAQSEGGDLIQLVALEINPADVGKWTGGIQQIIQAATQASLKEEYAWSFWQEDVFRYRLVYPVAKMAYFDDPEQWIRQYANTPGQATLMRAFEQLNTVESTTLSEMVMEHVPSWSRGEMDVATMPHAHVDEMWPKPGTEQQLDAIMKEFIGFVEGIGYPYPVHGYRPRLGGTGEHLIVTFFDSRENFYGKNDLDRLIDTRGKTQQWQEMLGRFSALVKRVTHYDSDFRPELSYMPTTTTSGGAGSR